jgi:hypothetical protein
MSKPPNYRYEGKEDCCGLCEFCVSYNEDTESWCFKHDCRCSEMFICDDYESFLYERNANAVNVAGRHSE